MTIDPMLDLDEERDAYYPFQRGYVARGSPTPYVIAVLALAILAAVGSNLVSVNDADMQGPEKQVTTDSRPAAGSSASFN